MTQDGVCKVVTRSQDAASPGASCDPWPVTGDLVIYQRGGAAGIPLETRVGLWLGNDFPRGPSRSSFLFLSQEGVVCRTFNSRGFIVVNRMDAPAGAGEVTGEKAT